MTVTATLQEGPPTKKLKTVTTIPSPTGVLFTGGAGFLGSNVMSELINRYPSAKLVCVDNLGKTSSSNNIKILKEKENFIFVNGDITSNDLVNFLIIEHKIDTIIHFAAQTHVDESQGNSLPYTKTNVIGTHVLLESCKVHKEQIKRFIHISTDEVYGRAKGEPEDEDEKKSIKNKKPIAFNPANPYSATKAASELLIKSYHYSYQSPIIIIRVSNVYGPRQYPEKLIPKIIYHLEKRKPFPIHGDGEHTRRYMHVDDFISAFFCIMEKGKFGKSYNLASKEEVSNKQVVDKLMDIFEIPKTERSELVKHVPNRNFNDFRFPVDASDLEELGFKFEVGFEEGLRQTQKWYLENRNWWGDVETVIKSN